MATNYTRIRYTVQLVAGQTVWSSRADIVEEIRQAKPAEMKIRGDGSADDHYMAVRSLDDLLTLLSDLKLIVINRDGRVSVSPDGARAARDPAVFDLLIKSSVRSLLEQGGAPIDKVFGTIRSIRLPAVPDARTIHSRMKTKNKTMPLKLDRFRRLLYLYFCAGGVERLVRVHYREPLGTNR